MTQVHYHVRRLLLVGLLAAVCAFAASAGEDPPDKPVKGFALEEELKETDRPTRSGVVVETPKAEVGDRDGKKVLRVGWRIKYSGERWPLVILEPSLTRQASGRTRLILIAKGKSGEAYSFALTSPLWNPFERNPHAPKDWFLTIPKAKGKEEGVLEVDLAEAKGRFLKYYPDDFDSRSAPELYVRLEHDVEERGEQVDLDAWTGHLMATTVKVANPKW